MIWSVPRIWNGEVGFVIGGGPSIRDFDFERLRGRGRVIAVNDAGIEPGRATWADVLFWADLRWLDWNFDKLHRHTGQFKISRKPNKYAFGFPVYELNHKIGTYSRDPETLGGWCGGSSAINLGALFGLRVIILLGFDMKEAPVMNWHSNHKLPHEAFQHRNKFIPTLERMAPQLERDGVTVINTNLQSGLRCFPFASIEEILAMDDIANIEREKYLAVWQRPEYRRVSPGMMEVERAWTVCGLQPGHSLIDFGSGPCRATKWFMDRGLHVTAIDFAPNAREYEDVPFVEACLWDEGLSDRVEQADWGFCTDVMEHIPSEKVVATLRNIGKMTGKGCYFRIATRPDKMGMRLINKPLHMTIEQGSFWRTQIENHFETVDVIEQTDRDIMVLARH